MILQWRHDERDGVWNQWRFDCLLNRLFRHIFRRKHQSSAALALGRGIHRWPVSSTHKKSVTRKMFLFYDVIIEIWKWFQNSEVTEFNVHDVMGTLSALLAYLRVIHRHRHIPSWLSAQRASFDDFCVVKPDAFFSTTIRLIGRMWRLDVHVTQP